MGDKVLKVVRYKVGYEVRTLLVDGKKYGSKDFEVRQAYTSDGKYIGDPKTAKRLCVGKGIKPELAYFDSNVCSIGYSEKEGKWYGWSHRAIFGFMVGSKIKVGDCGYLSKKDGGRGGWTAKTMVDAKSMALDFADGVS